MTDEFSLWMSFMDKAAIVTANKKRRRNGWKLQTTQTLEEMENEAIRAWGEWVSARKAQAEPPAPQVQEMDLDEVDVRALQEFLKQRNRKGGEPLRGQRVVKAGA
jgi:hypothetical protein